MGPSTGDRQTEGRREDPALVRGRDRYTDDHRPGEGLHLAFLRSRYAHARVNAVDTGPARAVDGVVDAFSAGELAEVGAPRAIRTDSSLPGQDTVDRPLLVDTVARYGGDPVALVVAEDPYAASDGLDAVSVEYERLPAVTDAGAALEAEFSALRGPAFAEMGWEGGPASVEWAVGDREAVDRAFAEAAHVVDLSLSNQRLAPVPLETRATFATVDGGRTTVRTSTQTPHADRDQLAETLGVDPDAVRVVAPAVGGGFGTKGSNPYPEPPLVAWAARHYDRPARWVATRTEALRTDHHGRDVHADASLALDGDGVILGHRVDARVGIGGYPFRGPSSCYKSNLVTGAYDVPAVHCTVTGVLTNATPLGAYRGAGRPEAIYVLERLLDRAAAELDVDPAALRRRNFVPPDAFPYETAAGTVYDSGAYGAALDRALEVIDYEAFRERQARERDEGRYLGVGLSSFVENTSSGTELARIEFDASGSVTAYCGTADQGQGHATTFAGLVADELGVPEGSVAIREGDTDDLAEGTGAYGSRSVPSGGTALVECARSLLERGRALAADRLEVDPVDVRVTDGAYHPRGAPDRNVTLASLAADAGGPPDTSAGEEPGNAASGDGTGLSAEVRAGPAGRGYTFGTHAVTVEVDPATGDLEVLRYVAVDDCGVQLEPRLVEAQVHGGVGQGLGQALFEHAAYDDAGTLVTGSLSDYALPRAHTVPAIETEATETPTPWAPHGAKGVGEAGTIAAPPAVVNAVVDALSPLGVETVDMPLHAERVWQAVRDA